ncbi:MAG: DUF11 domain-containing protein, partial [Acidimicrobiia bacterium]|nr:DUF11 domain-containing protein [Acidimicrobiia bacterium]
SVQGYTYITIHVPTDWPSTEDLHIDLFSPEMNAANALDEARNASDTTFFEVYAAGTLVSVEVIDGLLDIDADRTVTAADDGTLFVTGDANGIAAIDGFVDVNDDAVIDATDDGTFAGFSIVDGYVDVDGDGTVPEASDDDYLWATPSPGTPTVAHSGNDSCQTTTETESLIQCRYLPQAGAGTWKRAVTLTAPVAAGRYVLRSQTGDRSGTAGINDDDNAWRVRIALDDDANPVTLPPANGDNPDLVDGTNDELVIGLIQVTYQHNEAGNETLSLYEFVGASQPSVAFHNFDIDGNVSVDYISPSGGSTAGTVSGNAVWNNGGTGTSRGGDTILTPEEGWWRIDTLFTPNNQLIQEGRTRVPGFFEQPPTPIVEVTKSDGQSRISPGDRVTWTITFSNVSDDPAKNGGVTPGAAVNIVLSDNVPAQTTYVGCGINPPFTGTCSESAGVVTYSVNEALVAGAMGSVTLTADVDLTAAGVIFNEVTIDFEDSANVATFDVETDADTDLLPGTCFAAARGPNTTTVDRLIAIDRTGGGFQDIGPTTGATDIRALAFEPGTDTLYSVDNAAAGGPTLGTHDLTDGSFTPIGAALTTCTASGGPRTITAVEGLSFDPVNANLWASTSSTTVAADILFQLDRTTGALVPNLFGPGVDCLDTSLNSILDIAVDPTGAPFYASDGAQLYIVNTVTGVATLVGPFGAGAVTDMAGLGFNNAGNLSGTTGASNTPASGDDELWLIDETTGAATFVYDLKAAPSVYPDYESLDCLTDPSNRLQGVVFNDLNTNGVYDPSSGDLGQGGVTVRLYVDTNNDGLVDGGDTLIQSTTTSVDGSYGFFVGVPGNYVVDTVYPGTYPATALLTTDNVEEADFAGTGETDVGNNFGFSLPSDLAVTKTSNATSTVVAGQTIVYTITISNPAGPLQTGITVADPLPAGTIYVAQSTVVVGFDNVGAVTKDNVPAGVNPDLTDGTPPDLVVVADAFQLNTGQSMTVTFSVTVEDPLDYTRGQILNIATVDSNQSPPVQASVSDPLSQGGSIGDRVWLDLDGDGVQDVGEPGLANITVQLVQVVGAAGGADDVVVATTETSLDGSYTFTGIAPETYYVNVVDADVPSGLVRSPNNGNADPTDGPPLGAPGRTFTITAEEDYRDADFGYRPADGTAVVGDFVWIDADDDGKQDPGEPGVGGVTLDLVNARTGAVIASTTTTGDGRYLFTNVARGKYRVDVTDTAGVLTSYTLTNGPQSSKDPTVPLNIAPGESYLRADFGYFKSGLLSISDDVWLDTNGNGLRDPGEQGVADVTVNLVRTYGIIDGKVDIDRDGSITTGDDGLFEGFAIIDGVLDLDGDGAAGEANGDDDGTIGGVTVDDGLLDLDGDTTAGETNGDDSGTFTGQIIASTVTDANGEFTFSGLENGNYEIVVEDKAGKLKGKRGTTAPGVAKRLGRSLAGADLDDENFGYANSGQVTGVVWRDVDGDGVRDVGEAGVPGVTVELRDGVCTPGSNCPTATTDASGSYSFDGLEPGTYTVVITDDAGVLLGSTQTGDPDESGTCATCDDQGAAAVGSASGPSIDFGYQADLADVSGTVFEDLDADGVEEAGEGGIEGVTLDLVPVYTIVDGLVDLDGDGSITATDDGSLEGIAIIDGFFDVDGDGTAGEVNGDDDGFVNGFTIIDGALDLDGDGTAGEVTEDSGILEGQAVATTTTDGSGNYLFADVLDGDYKVKVTDSAGLLDGYTLTSGLDAIDVTVAGSDREDIDFGYVAAVETGSIGDSIFFDLDRDGDQDAGEGGIVGVTVDLAPAYAIVDGKVDINGDGSITAADDGLFEGFTVIDGVLDLDGDGIAGEVNGDDDGTVGGITVVNGLLDLDGDATAGETNGDDDG